MFLVILDSIILPFQLSFKHGTPDDAFDEFWFWLTTIIFFTDVFLSFNTAVANPSEPGTWTFGQSCWDKARKHGGSHMVTCSTDFYK